ncbi:Na+/H+ antiporter [Lysinimonas soli]|uniref:Na+/H+ antiporter n=1 Tax=Lysinimonas soli TaxID=1074233 RepID=A0ABW0NS54_9MICO
MLSLAAPGPTTLASITASTASAPLDTRLAVIWVVAFVLVTVTITGISGRVGWSAPIVLVAVGAVVSFISAVPRIGIDPELVLYGVIPPLLFAAAIRTSFRDVRARNDSILMLSIGLVAFTVVAIGFAAWILMPAIGLAAAFAFGAVVAPTDAVAVTAIAGRINLPRRVVTILEGESLLNDATALVALNASIAAIVAVVNPWVVAGDFVIAVVGGVAVGLAVGWVLAAIRKRLHAPVLDTSLSLITPYLAFIAAQSFGGSGVLAVVIAGLFLGYRSPSIQSAEARVAERLNWRTIDYLLQNAVFLFIGLNLSAIVEGALKNGPGVWPTVGICLGILLALVVVRFIWVFAITLLYRRGPRFLRSRGWSWRNAAAVSSAGIRGVVTLIAVFLLPPETPQRSFLQFLAFVVVVGTLLEGLLLPTIIRALKLPAPNYDQEHQERFALMAEAEQAGVDELANHLTDSDEEEVVERLRMNSAFLEEAIANPPEDGREPRLVAYTRLRKTMIAAQRQAVLQARREGRYQEPAVLSVLAAIDAEETALKLAAPRKKA